MFYDESFNDHYLCPASSAPADMNADICCTGYACTCDTQGMRMHGGNFMEVAGKKEV
jgi:hypothetical protein